MKRVRQGCETKPQRTKEIDHVESTLLVLTLAPSLSHQKIKYCDLSKVTWTVTGKAETRIQMSSLPVQRAFWHNPLPLSRAGVDRERSLNNSKCHLNEMSLSFI